MIITIEWEIMNEMFKNEIRAIIREEITAAIKSTTEYLKMQENEEKRYLTLKQAADAYCKTSETIRKYCRMGVIQGVKLGDDWQIETPADRMARLTNINN